jgi:K+ transporter
MAISLPASIARSPLRRFLNRLVTEQPTRVSGTAVFLSSSPGSAPAALLNNLEHNHVVHEHVVLLTVKTAGTPHVPDSERLSIERLRLGFVAITARLGYQDAPDVPALLRLAKREGLDIDVENASYYVNHISLIPGGNGSMAGWRKRLFTLLYKNSTPAARYFKIPPSGCWRSERTSKSERIRGEGECSTERAGFEPANEETPITRFPVALLKPTRTPLLAGGSIAP